MSLKIAIFSLCDFFKVQGSTEMYYVYKYLSQKHKTYAYIPGDHYPESKPGITKIKCPRFLPTFILYNIKIISRFRHFKNTDIVYTFQGIIMPVILLKFILRKKWVVDFRTSPIEQNLEFKKIIKKLNPLRKLIYITGSFFYRLTLPHCDLVIAITREVKQELIDIYKVPPHKIHVQSLGVNTNTFKPGHETVPIEQEMRLVYTGSIALFRGIDTIIQAISILSNKLNIKLFIAGTGTQDDLNSLKNLARELDLANNIKFLGYLSHYDIPAVLDECHIGISPLPALKAYQVSSPAKIFEYLAMQKIVIATDIPAHRKIISHQENGIIIPPNSPNAMANALEELYFNSKLRDKLINNSRKSVMKYDWQVMLPYLERRIRELTK